MNGKNFLMRWKQFIKNNMVRDFYDRMGFTKVSEDAEGNTVWEFDLTGDYSDKNTHINVNPGEENL